MEGSYRYVRVFWSTPLDVCSFQESTNAGDYECLTNEHNPGKEN
jgi:hypothetical protein